MNEEAAQVRAFVDTVPGGDAPAADGVAGEAQAERQGRRRNRRGGRGGRDRDETRQGETAEAVTGDSAPLAAPQDEPVRESAEAAPLDAEGAPVAEGGERAERDGRRRGRGRGGRDRQRRDENGEAAAPAEASATDEPAADTTADEPRGVIAAHTETAEPAPAPAVADERPPAVVATAPVAPAPVPVPVAAPAPVAVVPSAPVAAPAVQASQAAFVLPTDQLASVAESAGLQWVNSDADKIRAVQEAMAREPKPVHVPREAKPPVAADEGPLVLVETRKDLSQVKLPFEADQGSQPQA